jgi:hypothetical protein
MLIEIGDQVIERSRLYRCIIIQQNEVLPTRNAYTLIPGRRYPTVFAIAHQLYPGELLLHDHWCLVVRPIIHHDDF